MYKKIVLILLFVVPFSFAQDKYFIYFKDKGISKTASLNKTSEQYNEALSLLSERSIERRKKTMGEDFITYDDLPVSKNYVSQLKDLGIKIVHELKWFNSVSAYLNEEQKSSIEKLPFIEKVQAVRDLKYKNEPQEEINILSKPSGTTDINYGLSFDQLNLSGIPVVHSKGITGEGVLLGLLDSGFDWKTHESLMDATVVAEHDFIQNDDVTANQSGDASNQHNHGTTIFSVVGGYKDGAMIGAAFGADFILAKTEYIPTETHVEEDNYAAALIWMEEYGVDVTSSSLGYSEFDSGEFSYTYADMNGVSTIVTQAVEEAFSKGVITVTAGGNEGADPWHYITAPGDGFNVLTIGAVNSINQIASFSGRGPTYDGRIKPDVTARGVGVYGAVAATLDRYSTSSGTSLSTPIASGVAALLLSAYPHLTNVQVRNILLETSGNSESPDNDQGYGLLSAPKAISFPNLQELENSYRLNKAFLDKSNVDSSSVMLHYSINSQGFIDASVSYDGNYKYTFDFPLLQGNNEIDFYYTFSDIEGNTFREPEAKDFYFEYGETVISDIKDNNVPGDYALGQNYPNPFNSQTKINFTAGLNEKAELVIIDAIGQKIKMLFDGLTKNGTNTVVWDGKTENGLSASSGVYYYILKLSGKEYGRKMVLLK